MISRSLDVGLAGEQVVDLAQSLVRPAPSIVTPPDWLITLNWISDPSLARRPRGGRLDHALQEIADHRQMISLPASAVLF